MKLMNLNFLQRFVLGKNKAAEIKAIGDFIGGRFEISGGRLVMPADNKDSYIQCGYNANDIIYSVINMILDKVRLPYWALYKVVDEKKLRQSERIMQKRNITTKEYKEAQVLRKDALEPIENTNLQLGKLDDLLDYPNENDSFEDFVTFGSLYKLLTGDVYMWGDVLTGGAREGIPNQIWVLPAQHMTINITDQFPARAAGYELMAWNQRFRPREVLHEIYPNPNWGLNGEQLYGFSPLRPFMRNTVRNNSAKEASAAKFQNGGTEELIYVDDNRWTPEQGKTQAEFIKQKLLSPEYRGSQVQGKIAISGIKMGSVKLGLSPVDLGIIDSEKWDAIMFCNGYGVPPELLGLTAKTFNNMKEAEKALTTRSALPLLTSRRNALNRKLQTDWGFKDVNVYVDYETECFSELQSDQGETATWLDKVIMMTPDEQREFLNMDSLNTKESQEVWVKTSSGFVPLTDFQATAVDAQLMADILNPTNGQQNGNGIQSRANGKPVAAN